MDEENCTVFIREKKGDNMCAIIGKFHREISFLELIHPNLFLCCRANSWKPENQQQAKTQQHTKLGHLFHSDYEICLAFMYQKLRVLIWSDFAYAL